MENQGDKTGDDENKADTCLYCPGKCDGVNCQFPSLQAGVRQARMPRKHRRAKIPELNESSLGASSLSHGTEHPTVNQVEGAEQACSVPPVKKVELNAEQASSVPPVQKVDELNEKHAAEMDELWRLTEDFLSLGNGTESPSVNQVKAKAGTSAMPSGPQRYFPPSPVQGTTASVSTTPSTNPPPSDWTPWIGIDLALPWRSNEGNPTKREESKHCESDVLPSSESRKRVPALNKSSEGTSSSSHGTDRSTVNQVGAAAGASSLPYVPQRNSPTSPVQDTSLSIAQNTEAASLSSHGTKHPSFNQVEAAEAASPLPSEHPSSDKVEAAEADSRLPYEPKLFYGPGSPEKTDKINVDRLLQLMEETFGRNSPTMNSLLRGLSSSHGPGYYSPQRPPLPRSAGRARPSHYGTGYFLPQWQPLPRSSIGAKSSSHGAGHPPSQGASPASPTAMEDLSHIFENVLLAPGTGGSTDKTDGTH